ncbi:MAG: hypothetical protein KF819_18875 [Labilithrix sp.]|nr:hypothetical protein [Labilithrix sp.]
MRACFAAFASLLLVACGAYDAAEDPNAPAPKDGAQNTPAVALRTDARDGRAHAALTAETVGERGTKPAAFVCRKGAFCDDFEEKSLGTRWSDLVQESGGRVRLGEGSSASAGRGSLEIFTRDASSRAFLSHEVVADLSGSWSGALGFALRVDSVPRKALGGPELTMTTSDGVLAIGVVLKPEGLVLEQRATESCLKEDRCKSRSWVIAPALDNHWYDVRIGVEANPADIAPYGRIEITVDGGELLAGDLTIPMFDRGAFLRAGVTQGDIEPARAVVDDVSLLVR